MKGGENMKEILKKLLTKKNMRSAQTLAAVVLISAEVQAFNPWA
jgi:hypothetical protein